MPPYFIPRASDPKKHLFLAPPRAPLLRNCSLTKSVQVPARGAPCAHFLTNSCYFLTKSWLLATPFGKISNTRQQPYDTCYKCWQICREGWHNWLAYVILNYLRGSAGVESLLVRCPKWCVEVLLALSKYKQSVSDRLQASFCAWEYFQAMHGFLLFLRRDDSVISKVQENAKALVVILWLKSSIDCRCCELRMCFYAVHKIQSFDAVVLRCASCAAVRCVRGVTTTLLRVRLWTCAFLKPLLVWSHLRLAIRVDSGAYVVYDSTLGKLIQFGRMLNWIAWRC